MPVNFTVMKLRELIDEIDRLKAEIDAMRPIDKEREARIMQKFRLDWNFHSNNIEGNSLTYGETKTFLLHGLTAQGKPLKDHLDIKGHNEALLLLDDVVKEKRPITESFIRQLHEIILPQPYDSKAITTDGQPTVKHIVPGRYKQQPNHVQTQTGEIFYFATPEETPAKMGDLMAWLNSVIDDSNTHSLITASELHYRFVRIHPFDDGNGRMARLLMNLVLMRKGFMPAIIKSDKKEEYYRALREADGNNVEFFISYIGEQLLHSMNLFILGAKGEPIDDAGDVEKEIMLLKAELATAKSFKEAKSAANMKRLLLNDFRLIIKQYLKKVQLLDELFHNVSMIITRHNPGAIHTYNSSTDFWNEYEHLVNISVALDLREFQFSYVLKGFKKAQTNTFSSNSYIAIVFDEFTYSIRESANDAFRYITKTYDEKISIEDANRITDQIAKKLVEQIQRSRNQK